MSNTVPVPKSLAWFAGIAAAVLAIWALADRLHAVSVRVGRTVEHVDREAPEIEGRVRHVEDVLVEQRALFPEAYRKAEAERAKDRADAERWRSFQRRGVEPSR